MNKKLTINRETLRRLDPENLDRVVGGVPCSQAVYSEIMGHSAQCNFLKSVCICLDNPPVDTNTPECLETIGESCP